MNWEMLVFIALWLPAAFATGLSVTCHAPPVRRGETGIVTCIFPVTLASVPSVIVSMEHYPLNSSTPDDVLEVITAEKGAQPDIKIFKDNYKLNRDVDVLGKVISVQIAQVSEEHLGRYVCQMMSNSLNGTVQPEPCTFRFSNETAETMAAGDSDQILSKGVIAAIVALVIMVVIMVIASIVVFLVFRHCRGSTAGGRGRATRRTKGTLVRKRLRQLAKRLPGIRNELSSDPETVTSEDQDASTSVQTSSNPSGLEDADDLGGRFQDADVPLPAAKTGTNPSTKSADDIRREEDVSQFGDTENNTAREDEANEGSSTDPPAGELISAADVDVTLLGGYEDTHTMEASQMPASSPLDHGSDSNSDRDNEPFIPADDGTARA